MCLSYINKILTKEKANSNLKEKNQMGDTITSH